MVFNINININYEKKEAPEEKSAKRQKVAPVQEVQVEFPELIVRIDALSPALDLEVRAGDVVRVSAIIQQYNDYVDATYIDHMGYAFTPAIAVENTISKLNKT